ncbi:S1C family serine protease [Caldicellulosiruptor naganoensis]|uniref:Trypsin-like peptidase domain-containing protein n=1 Tax=Caldicellulosiruptor naganoensis TaxID=29324 RepID=A0ABY7BJ88_9FIRM|nr:trypsin-like peptidase domain-containing protein [Caldicellulosiruptor naganoensis]WAM32407.1 trypsin-like peptidase domain-containing protein [Caldicellulosiruptor naganoensis]
MKKLCKMYIVVFIVFSLISNVVFAQSIKVTPKVIDGKLYVDLDSLKDFFGFDYVKFQDGVIIQKKDLSVSEVIDKVNKSVVAIIGDSKKIKAEDFYYSKIPAGLTHGSGVVIDKNGLILTNNHVVEDMKQPYVIFYDAKAYKATVLYRNKDIDLAILKVNRTNLNPIEIENPKNIKVGQEVLAIGTPLFLGWQNSVTKGIISGLNRPVDESYTFLQTDAAINPGNSGGPLVNMQGKLVGINTLGIEYFQGINFAIPAENILYFLDHYKKFGKIRRCYLGLEFEDSWLSIVGLPSTLGLKIIDVKEDSPLKGFVQENDILVSIDNYSVNSIAEYNQLLMRYLPGDKVKLKIKRNGKIIEKEVVLKEYPENK